MISKSCTYFVFVVKQKQLVISIKQLVVFMKTLSGNLFQSIVLENNLLFSLQNSVKWFELVLNDSNYF